MKYTYQAEVLRVVDGDTIDVILDLGIEVHTKQRLRLARINAWEPKGEEREKGLRATNVLISKLSVPLQDQEYYASPFRQIRVETIKDKTGKYGRYLAEIWLDDLNINDWLVKEGHARYVDY